MRGLLKGLIFAAVGLTLLIPLGIALVAVGIPLLIVGAVALGVMAVGAVAITLPVVLVAAAVAGLIGVIFGIFALILGLGFIAVKLTMLVMMVLFAFQLLGRLLMGRSSRPEAIAEPVHDHYDAEAERELDRELRI